MLYDVNRACGFSHVLISTNPVHISTGNRGPGDYSDGILNMRLPAPPGHLLPLDATRSELLTLSLLKYSEADGRVDVCLPRKMFVGMQGIAFLRVRTFARRQ
jgi:hypothetical protein